MTYVPTFARKDARERALTVLSWCSFHLYSPKKTLRVGKETITRVFGRQPLGKYLKEHLLTMTAPYVVGKQPAAWGLKVLAYTQLKTTLGVTEEHLLRYIEHWLSEEEVIELETLNFRYRHAQSERLHHSLQNLIRSRKPAFWKHWGLTFNVDVVCCSATLLYQYALRQGADPKLLEPIHRYMTDSDAVRAHIQDLTGCERRSAKKLITAFFNGARLSESFKTASGSLFNPEQIQQLKTDTTVAELRVSIGHLWAAIEAEEMHLDSSSKAYVYYWLERQVLDVFIDHLIATGNRHFCEHDGFIAQRSLDLRLLAAEVKTKTGFDIRLESSIF